MPELLRVGSLPFHGGANKDKTDPRDIRLNVQAADTTLPPRYSLTGYQPPVRDQGQEGTCVSFACVGAMDYYEKLHRYPDRKKLSPRYIYYRGKLLEGSLDEEGMYPRNAMRALAQFGCCHEEQWPYIAGDFMTPTDAQMTLRDTEAAKHKTIAYARLTSVTEMKFSLIQNGPFVIALPVFASWEEATTNGGFITMPDPGETPQGGHALLVTAYNNAYHGGVFQIKNSWGKGFTPSGYLYVPFVYVSKYLMDAWTFTTLIPMDLLMQAAEAEKDE
jgi:C1A family cysteine protease